VVDRPGGAAEPPEGRLDATLAQLTTAEQRWADREEDITTVGGDPYEVGQVFARRWMDRLGDHGQPPAETVRMYPRARIASTANCLRYAARSSASSPTRTTRSTSTTGTRSGPVSGARSTYGRPRSTAPPGSERTRRSGCRTAL